MRKRIARVFYIAATIAGVIFVATSIYGISKYPAAPIRPEGATYKDKLGNDYTEQEYESFEAWKRAMMLSGASCFALAFSGQIIAKVSKREIETESRI
jgi:hypothetical protein